MQAWLHPNERRLVATARAGLQLALGADAFAAACAAGAAMSKRERRALITATLSGDPGPGDS